MSRITLAKYREWEQLNCEDNTLCFLFQQQLTVTLVMTCTCIATSELFDGHMRHVSVKSFRLTGLTWHEIGITGDDKSAEIAYAKTCWVYHKVVYCFETVHTLVMNYNHIGQLKIFGRPMAQDWQELVGQLQCAEIECAIPWWQHYTNLPSIWNNQPRQWPSISLLSPADICIS